MIEATPPRWGKTQRTDLGAYRPTGSLDLPHINLSPGCFSDANRLARCVNGAVYKWEHNGNVVAAKVMSKKAVYHLKSAETNDLLGWWRGANEVLEDPLTEIGVLQKLAKQPEERQCEFLLTLHGIYETKRNVIIMTEFATGGELLSVVQQNGPLPEWQVKEYMQQLFAAIEHLNKLYIAHRDVSLENLVLNNGTLRLMDFGAACQIEAADGTALRYFRSVGKPYYIAPEMYIPRTAEVTVAWTSGDARPGEVHFVRTTDGHLIDVKLPQDFRRGVPCPAQPWGYETQKVDAFAAGVCFYMMSFGVVPWHRAILQDKFFFLFYKHGEAGLNKLLEETRRHHTLPALSAWAMDLMMWTLQVDPYNRPDAEICSDHEWFHLEEPGEADDPLM
eukprot:CAMPEP_0178438964 /NCGR_PEP_ID=MMETSP0689_2-20121128/35888_1 /TAXON_ID=160604 /ORGANISM="Amphidinium massartii, Strain CS-259" /LENGTH=389 /DNA_ID=CAMNT_0020061431 /DNA_START=96 /DNA_END=1265 /DNA_ORIENTATION=-